MFIEKKTREILLSSLGVKRYLELVSDAYIRLIKLGFFKTKYPELFFLKVLIKPGFVCIDIGANVGYYSVFLSKFVAESGHVYSVEPVPLFAEVFVKNTKKFALENISLYQTALGAEQKRITMGTPQIEGVFRHGLTKVIDSDEQNYMKTYEVEMLVPNQLFSFLDKLDFVKCDVEGYEVNLFPHFLEVIQKFKPIIQIEISGEENRRDISSMLEPIGYKPYKLSNSLLEVLSPEEMLTYSGGDFYFKTE